MTCGMYDCMVHPLCAWHTTSRMLLGVHCTIQLYASVIHNVNMLIHHRDKYLACFWVTVANCLFFARMSVVTPYFMTLLSRSYPRAPKADSLDACASRRNFWRKFFVVSISTASLLEVVFRHCFTLVPVKPLKCIQFLKVSGRPLYYLYHCVWSWRTCHNSLQRTMSDS